MHVLANSTVCIWVEEWGQKQGICETIYVQASQNAQAVLSRNLFTHSSISSKRPEWGRQDPFLRKESVKNQISP